MAATHSDGLMLLSSGAFGLEATDPGLLIRAVEEKSLVRVPHPAGRRGGRGET